MEYSSAFSPGKLDTIQNFQSSPPTHVVTIYFCENGKPECLSVHLNPYASMKRPEKCFGGGGNPTLLPNKQWIRLQLTKTPVLSAVESHSRIFDPWVSLGSNQAIYPGQLNEVTISQLKGWKAPKTLLHCPIWDKDLRELWGGWGHCIGCTENPFAIPIPLQRNVPTLMRRDASMLQNTHPPTVV